MQQFSDETRKKIVDEINALRSAGWTAVKACAKVGTTTSNYGNWNAKFKTAKPPKPAKKYNKKPKVLDLTPVTSVTSQRVYAVFGTPTEIAEVIRGIQ